MNSFSVDFLGQAGFRISSAEGTVYIDPYLSDSVRALDSADLIRQVAIPVSPADVRDATWVLITHDHIDHCDPHTLPVLSDASPDARFVAPPPAAEKLLEWGIAPHRIQTASETWHPLLPGLSIKAVPAAHPSVERDPEGRLACVGYLFSAQSGQRTYFAGDTGVTQELLDALSRETPIRTAFLPVNEQNFFRARRGIIGNMSVREAFLLAAELGTKRLFPYHWDMFAINDAYPEEISLIHRKTQAPFVLLSSPCNLFE
ncbi:MAG TPA: MBL fold metallo-hydrolase [Aromatoleum sp.]|uniref:MBL fold metallo-hydrolase n=1 Tax=Aromatoleum sp. TaxID=2307007 RepID=UPI002B483302|nr:MBL fold metallo-hydrolase [Aromatoleum sp.]HJV25556.1 MBL fold metallo-hydrolase [Aromatoleum sp.]